MIKRAKRITKNGKKIELINFTKDVEKARIKQELSFSIILLNRKI